MFCKKCGAQIDDAAAVCPQCGAPTVEQTVTPGDAPSIGIAVLGFFFPLIGLILYLVWKDTSPLKAKSAGKGALIGVIVSVVLSIIWTVLAGTIFAGVMSGLRY